MASKPAQVPDQDYAQRLAQTGDELHLHFKNLLYKKKLRSPLFKRAIDEAPTASVFDEMFSK